MIEQLLQYQNVDTKLREIETEISQSEERKKAVSAQKFLNSVNDSIALLEKRAEELANKYNESVALYKRLGDEIKEYDDVDETDDIEQLGYVKRKAQELNDEIENLANGIEQISREISVVLKEFTQLKSKTKEAKSQYSEFVPKYNALKASKEEEMKKIKAELAKIEKQIPPEEMELYKTKRKDKIFPVLYAVQVFGKKPHCSRCGTEFPMACFDSLKKGSLVECDSCHRLVYYKEEK